MQSLLAYNIRSLLNKYEINHMALAIFDLDNTLLGGDSDYLWGEFLVENNIVDGTAFQQKNQAFYEQYLAGTMDIFEFLAFQLKPLADNSLGVPSNKSAP